jgi:hypothetical protein
VNSATQVLVLCLACSNILPKLTETTARFSACSDFVTKSPDVRFFLPEDLHFTVSTIYALLSGYGIKADAVFPLGKAEKSEREQCSADEHGAKAQVRHSHSAYQTHSQKI